MHTIPAKTLGRAAPTRRGLIGAGAVAACATDANIAQSTSVANDEIEADLRTYVEVGPKNAGGPGDEATGAWLEARLAAMGYALSRQPVPAIGFRENNPRISIGQASAPLATHCLGGAGAFGTETHSVFVWSAPHLMASFERNAIVFAHLPSQRWSSAEQPLIRDTITRAFGAGASALVLITHGPTGELIHLNRRMEAPNRGPIALLAPRAWPPLQAALADRSVATLALNASIEPRPAFNVSAKLERGGGRWLVISTPRSGWTLCGGERAPGAAAFLALAGWTARRFPRLNVACVATSAHEFENAGGAVFLENGAPPPEETELWLHLGAGFAARDWHEAGGRLLPLPSADPQRFLVATPDSVEAARRAFAGVAGLEAAYDTSQGSAGELQNIIAARYRAAGLFGAHRFHHVAQDDLRCVDASFATTVIERLQHFLDERLG